MDLTARAPGSSGGVSVAGGGHAFLAVSAEGVEPNGHYIE